MSGPIAMMAAVSLSAVLGAPAGSDEGAPPPVDLNEVQFFQRENSVGLSDEAFHEMQMASLCWMTDNGLEDDDPLLEGDSAERQYWLLRWRVVAPRRWPDVAIRQTGTLALGHVSLIPDVRTDTLVSDVAQQCRQRREADQMSDISGVDG